MNKCKSIIQLYNDTRIQQYTTNRILKMVEELDKCVGMKFKSTKMIHRKVTIFKNQDYSYLKAKNWKLLLK